MALFAIGGGIAGVDGAYFDISFEEFFSCCCCKDGYQITSVFINPIGEPFCTHQQIGFMDTTECLRGTLSESEPPEGANACEVIGFETVGSVACFADGSPVHPGPPECCSEDPVPSGCGCICCGECASADWSCTDGGQEVETEDGKIVSITYTTFFEDCGIEPPEYEVKVTVSACRWCPPIDEEE
jgi:hypothetical protein